ncbi:MAG TPA: hypothetical protein VIW70_00195 [Rubrivivax sp.]
MLDSLKKWFGEPARRKGWDALAPWAEGKQYVFRGVRKSEGFVIDGRMGAMPWRLEWGPSQRGYVEGHELRLRGEVGLPADLQVLVLTRELQESMERTVFDQYVEGVQTRIDTSTPPEMRWLVMYPKLGGAELKTLRDRYAAVANHKPWLTHWIDGPLADELRAAPGTRSDPLVLMVARGRLMLRAAVAEPEPEALDRWLLLFETAMREARRAISEIDDLAPGPSTQPSLWTSSAMPRDAAESRL